MIVKKLPYFLISNSLWPLSDPFVFSNSNSLDNFALFIKIKLINIIMNLMDRVPDHLFKRNFSFVPF